MNDNCSHAVINLEDPQVAWKTLKDMYKCVSDACVDGYLEKLHSLQMMDKKKVMVNVNRLVKL